MSRVHAGNFKITLKCCMTNHMCPTDRFTAIYNISGGLTSPRTPVSEPLSLTESMQLLDEILSDGRMERLDKIERLEAVLSVITSPPAESGGTESVLPCCLCRCHANASLCDQQGTAGSKARGQ